MYMKDRNGPDSSRGKRRGRDPAEPSSPSPAHRGSGLGRSRDHFVNSSQTRDVSARGGPQRVHAVRFAKWDLDTKPRNIEDAKWPKQWNVSRISKTEKRQDRREAREDPKLLIQSSLFCTRTRAGHALCLELKVDGHALCLEPRAGS